MTERDSARDQLERTRQSLWGRIGLALRLLPKS